MTVARPNQAVSWAWQDAAACAGMPVELFVGPEGETPTRRRAREEEALQVCVGCPVRAPCLTHALTQPETYGVWGGTTESERAKRRPRRRTTQRTNDGGGDRGDRGTAA